MLFKALFFQNNKYQIPISVCQSTESNVVHASRSLLPLRSSSLPGFNRDNRIPGVAPANRTKICAIHMDDHVTFCHGEERKREEQKKSDKT